MAAAPNSAPAALLLMLALALTAGCQQEMANQPRFEPLEYDNLFGRVTSARDIPEGTVARGLLRPDEPFFTGYVGDEHATEFPIEITRQVLERGRERYNIFCSPCHDYVGTGNGMVMRRGFRRHPPSFHIDRLREAPPGHFFDVITNGFGAMNDYAMQIQPADRWAIAAYIRALQLSQNAPVNILNDEDRRMLEGTGQQ